MAFVTKLRTFASKIESVAGTAETLTNADNNLRVTDLAIASLDVPMDQSPAKYATGDMFNDYGIPGPQAASINGSVKLFSDGPSTEPAWTKLIKGCGVSATSEADGYVLYPAKQAIGTSLTIGIYDQEAIASPQALFYSFPGCVGNCSIKADGVGKPYVAAFEFKGGLEDITDVALTAVPVFSASSNVIPDRFLNGSITIGSFSACISTLEFNLGNTVNPIECIGAADGIVQYIITESAPTLTVNPLLMRNSEYDFWGKFTAGTMEEVVVETAQFKLTIPRAQITNASVGDRAGVLETPLSFAALRAATAGSYNYAPWTLQIK